eukprot:3786812-Rhodomonas_salina.1
MRSPDIANPAPIPQSQHHDTAMQSPLLTEQTLHTLAADGAPRRRVSSPLSPSAGSASLPPRASSPPRARDRPGTITYAPFAGLALTIVPPKDGARSPTAHRSPSPREDARSSGSPEERGRAGSPFRAESPGRGDGGGGGGGGEGGGGGGGGGGGSGGGGGKGGREGGRLSPRQAKLKECAVSWQHRLVAFYALHSTETCWLQVVGNAVRLASGMQC